MNALRVFVALAVGLALAVAMRPDIAAAQTSAESGGSAPLPEIVVTGTSIKGINAETALPVQVRVDYTF